MDSMVGYAAAAGEGMPASPRNERAIAVVHFAPFMPLAALFIQTYLQASGLAAAAVAVRPDGDPLAWLAGRGIAVFAGGVAFQWSPELAAGLPECRFPAGARELAEALRDLVG
jgi:hypothetical protein